jgi:hypothetical protein
MDLIGLVFGFSVYRQLPVISCQFSAVLCPATDFSLLSRVMKWAHLIFGIALFVVFTITGQYMRADFPDKDAIPQDLRLLMRSRHIYILFSAFVHIALGVYLQVHQPTWQRIVQYAGSSVLFVSSILLIWAFIAETYSYGKFSEISRFGIYTSLAGVALHLIGGIGQNRER